MKHTLDGIAFEAPDTLGDFSDYSYDSPTRTSAIVFQIADDEPDDDATLLAAARTRYEGMFGPLIIYVSPIAFVRADGSPVVAAEGEQRDMSDRSKRLRFAIAAIATDRGKAVILYNGPAGADSLAIPRAVLRNTFVLGDPVPRRPIPKGWRRHQASRMVLSVPARWSGPTTLTFRSEVELRVTVTEPLAPPGEIDLARAVPGAAVRVSRSTKPESIATPHQTGWAAEWIVDDGTGPANEQILRKMSVALGPAKVVTLYGKAPSTAFAALEATWQMVRGTLALDGDVK